MKILRISLKNLASLEGTHTVDFTREPLQSAGLFSISGPTGSGKSTLLDALCLALYEKTPRLSAVRGVAKMPDGKDSILQKDAATILRRGTGDGFAEVAFVGIDGVAYTARWMVRRARNSPEGNLQNTEMALFRENIPAGGNGVVVEGGRKSDVLQAIEAKVGLTFEQFTRAVLLAQNDFAAFLKADDRERAEILQALTGTDKFERISIRVYQRCEAEKDKIKDVELQIGANVPLTPEARLEAEVRVKQADENWAVIHSKIQSHEAHLAWFKKKSELATEEKVAEETLAGKIAARNAAAPRRLELAMAEEAARTGRGVRDTERILKAALQSANEARSKAEKALSEAAKEHTTKVVLAEEAAKTLGKAKADCEAIKPQLAKARELDGKAAPLLERRTAAIREREVAEENCKRALEISSALAKRRQAAVDETGTLEKKRSGLAGYAPFVADAALWLHRLDAVSAFDKHLQKARKIAEGKKVEEQKCLAELASQRKKETDFQKAATEAGTAFGDAELKAKAFDAEKIARERAAADDARIALSALQQQLRETAKLRELIDTAEREIGQLKAEQDRDQQVHTRLKEKEIPEAEQALRLARETYSITEAAISDHVIALREKLAPDHPCPVCGGVLHPFAHEAPSADGAALRALKKQCEEKERTVATNGEKAAQLAAAISSRSIQIREREKVKKDSEARLKELASTRHEHACVPPILALPGDAQLAAVESEIATRQKAYLDADTADTARRNAEKLRDDCRKRHETATVRLTDCRTAVAKAAEQLAGITSAREAADAQLSQLDLSRAAAVAELDPIFRGVDGSRVTWEADADSFRSSFETATTSLAAIDLRLQQLSGEIREADAAMVPAQGALANSQKDLQQKQAAERDAIIAHDEVKKLRDSILGGRSAEAVEQEAADFITKAEGNARLRQEDMNRSAVLQAGLTEASSTAKKRHEDADASHQTSRVKLEEWITGMAGRFEVPIDVARLDGLLSRDDQWFQQEKTDLEYLASAVGKAEGTLEAQRKASQTHESQRPTLDDEAIVNTALLDAKAAIQKADEHRNELRAVVRADDERIKASAALVKELDARRIAANPWIKLNELIGSADGAKFRAIAQRRTLELLLGYGNAQLEHLSSRYRLERLPESLNLLVIDKDMADERRSVHSLSGGESFLVSLALALALASLTSNRVRIESLFIDEGFGSLDPDTLNVAMGALMRLESQGRKVGVISHVSEMAEAIPVQIRVTKSRSGASRLHVPGNAAPSEPDVLAAVQQDPDAENIASLIIEMLRREQAAGAVKVSIRALREAIGCSPDAFLRARDVLGGKIRIEGRSLALPEVD